MGLCYNRTREMRKIIIRIAPFLFALLLCPEASASKCEVTDKTHTFAGDELQITGAEFGSDAGKGNAYFYEYDESATKDVKKSLFIINWTDTQVDLIVPKTKSKQILVQLYRDINGKETKLCEDSFQLNIIGEVVSESITLKRNRYSQKSIINHLAHKRLSNGDPTFGKYQLSAEEMSLLKDEGFEVDYIEKLEGQSIPVTVGVMALRLTKSNKITFGPVIRIMLVPRSYFHPYKPYFDKYYPKGLLHLDRWDLNLGYTTSTKSDNGESDDGNFFLGGFSHQINQGALLNIGFALLDGQDGKEGQFYYGITLDTEFLKLIGFIDK